VSWIMESWFDVRGVGLPKVQPAAERAESDGWSSVAGALQRNVGRCDREQCS